MRHKTNMAIAFVFFMMDWVCNKNTNKTDMNEKSYSLLE